MMLWKCCTQYASKFGNAAVATGLESQFSFQSQRTAMPKNVKITIQLYSFHMPERLRSKSFKLGFSSRWTENFQIYKLGLEDRGTRYQIANICWITEKDNILKNLLLLHWLQKKPLTLWITANWKILRDGSTRPQWMVTAAMKLKDAFSLEEKLQ